MLSAGQRPESKQPLLGRVTRKGIPPALRPLLLSVALCGLGLVGPVAAQTTCTATDVAVTEVITDATDKYGRVLGIVLYKDKDVGEWLVRKGYAIAAYGEQYKHVEAAARRARRGMWGHAEVHDPRAWRHR